MVFVIRYENLFLKIIPGLKNRIVFQLNLRLAFFRPYCALSRSNF